MTWFTNDKVDTLHDLPRCCTGAPLSLVVATEHNVYVAYYTKVYDPTWDGTTCRVMTPASDAPAAIVAFKHCYAHKLGPPNDEAFSGHPLASKGLHPCGAFEVTHSSWMDRLEAMNRVHPCHTKAAFFENKRHFILTFHDSTFECIAREVEVLNTFTGSMQDAATWMTRELLWVPPAGSRNPRP